MIKWWVECASLTIFKGKYHNQVDQSCGYNQDAGDRVKPVGSTTHFIKHSLCRNCYSLNVYSTTESFNIQVNVQLINSLAEGLSIRHCFDLELSCVSPLEEKEAEALGVLSTVTSQQEELKTQT